MTAADPGLDLLNKKALFQARIVKNAITLDKPGMAHAQTHKSSLPVH